MKQVNISSLKENLPSILSNDTRRVNIKASVSQSAGEPASASAVEPVSEAVRMSNSNQKSEHVRPERELTQKIVH